MWLWAALVAFGTVLASLSTGPWMFGSLAAMALVTVTLTFVVPVLKKPAVLEQLEGDPPESSPGTL
jgi:UDP-GlcNAc:undecaprenyl-phosphate GlcNAc-1-phosphate transferase